MLLRRRLGPSRARFLSVPGRVTETTPPTGSAVSAVWHGSPERALAGNGVSALGALLCGSAPVRTVATATAGARAGPREQAAARTTDPGTSAADAGHRADPLGFSPRSTVPRRHPRSPFHAFPFRAGRNSGIPEGDSAGGRGPGRAGPADPRALADAGCAPGARRRGRGLLAASPTAPEPASDGCADGAVHECPFARGKPRQRGACTVVGGQLRRLRYTVSITWRAASHGSRLRLLRAD